MNKPCYLIAGLGKTGLSIARYLHRRQWPFAVYDTRQRVPGLDDFKQEFPQVPVYLQDYPSELIAHLDAIITSPGVSLDEAIFKQAAAQGVVVYGDIECLAQEISAPILAITGTNGKSTVTSLVGEMAKEAGFRVAVAGNIGTPVLELLDDGHHYDVWVLELSSFQLDLTHSLRPKAATILNISPDHLDRHHHLDAYIAAKQRIYFQAETLLYNRDDECSKPQSETTSPEPHILSFGSGRPEDGNWGLDLIDEKTCLLHGQEKLICVDEMRIKGRHNWQNALAACALAETLGISEQIMAKVLKTFAGLPHRSQWVRTLDGVEWINDSKGTNVGATVSAISGIGSAMQGKIVLIAGGLGKGADFNDLQAVVSDFVRCVVLIGQDADHIEKALANTTSIIRADSMEAAVNAARLEAKSGDVVLLSPACASMDMFKDFNHRGEVFTTLVNQL